MTEKQNIIVEIKGLVKKYGKLTALNNIDVEIEQGKIVGLLGPNGSGKSTLLKAIIGLIKPSSGKITVKNIKPSYETKKLVSYLPEIDHLYPWMTVKETVEFVSTFYNDTWNHDKTQELLEFMGLDKSKQVKNLSKGMRERLKLVLCLSREVPLVILDEPLSGIDPSSRSRILQSIVSEYKVGDQTIILSTHSISEAESIFEEVIFLKEGCIYLKASAEDLRQQYGSSIEELWKEVYA